VSPLPSDDPVTVTGGTGGLSADLDDMEAVARAMLEAGKRLLGLAASSQHFLAHPDVVASAALDAAGMAAFELALGEALNGAAGLVARAGGIIVEAAALRTEALTYRAVDEAMAAATQVRRFEQGALFTLALPAAVVVAVGAYGFDKVLGRDPAADAQHLLASHPGIVDEVVGSAPGFITGMELEVEIATNKQFHLSTFFPTTVAGGASLAGLLYPETAVRVERMPQDFAAKGDVAPANLQDVMRNFQNRNAYTDQNRGLQSEIDVQAVTATGNHGEQVTTGYIVDIPGTKDWQFSGPRPYLNDFGTNVHALAGEPTAYEHGIEEALRQAGVPPGAPVMLVGHSQGGMVAVRAANDFVSSGKFNVTHVVTAGAPVGGMQVPNSVQVLSMENAHDIVPHLDGRPNPDHPNWTTVAVDRGVGDITTNHDMVSSYLPIAGDIDRSGDPSVRQFVGSANAFLGRSGVQTQVFDFHRVRRTAGNP
jgi:hypothetical protein